jgi:hypothetical protein
MQATGFVPCTNGDDDDVIIIIIIIIIRLTGPSPTTSQTF